MAKRKSLTKKSRFEVFKRDSFTCQYCGRSAPGVVLRVDHIHPVAKGGTNEVANLITACFDCNVGKSDRLLSDNSELAKQHAELARLQDRRNQLEMLKTWRAECAKVASEACQMPVDVIERAFDCKVGDYGRSVLGRLIKKHGIEEVIAATDIACEQYQDSEVAMKKIPGIIRTRKLDRELPGLSRHHYIVGILRNRGLYFDYRRVREFTEWFVIREIDVEELESAAKQARNWTQFVESVRQILKNDLATEAMQKRDEFGFATDKLFQYETPEHQDMEAW